MEENKLVLNEKLAVLEKAYSIYESFLKPYTFSCRKCCDHCCTCNVTMTTLEGCYLINGLRKENLTDRLNRLRGVPEKRFRPKYTFNRMAEIYAEGKEVIEEQCDPLWGKCPFLENRVCLIYPYRPFGCRCMVSTNCCTDKGFAEMPPLILTANHVFMQFVEHLDTNGYSGNLTDILGWMEDESRIKEYLDNGKNRSPRHLLANIPITVLMVPPEHREKIEKLMFSLNSILA